MRTTSLLILLYLSVCQLLGCGPANIISSTTIKTIKASLSSPSPTVNEGSVAHFTIQTSEVADTDLVISLVYSGDLSPSLHLAQAPSQVTLPKGSTQMDVAIPIAKDGIYQTHVLKLHVAATADRFIADGSFDFQVTNADPFPVVSATTVPTKEGQLAIVQVSLDRKADADLSFAYALSPGTALATDYIGTTGTVSILAGSLSNTLSIPLNTNAICESTKSFNVTLSAPLPSLQAPLVVAQNILENSPMTYTLTGPTLAEGASGSVVVTPSLVCPFDRTMTLSTADGTALAPLNYTALTSQTATLLANQSSINVPIQTKDDLMNGPNMTFTVAMSSVSIGTLPSVPATVNVTDIDPPPTLQWSVTSSSVGRAAGSATIAWSLSAASHYTITANLNLSGTAVNGTDYQLPVTSLNIPPGVASGNFTVTLFPAATYRGNVTLGLALASLSHASLGTNSSYTLTITDIAPTLSVISPGTVMEGTIAGYTVQLNKPSSTAITVNYATADGTGVAGTDYTATSGTLTFAAGDISKPVSVSTVHYTTVCQADRNFSLSLNTPSGATLGTASAPVTIQNDNLPSVAVGNVSVTEGSSAVLTATLSQSCGFDVQFSYQTQDGTAIAGKDYVAANGTIVMPAGTTSKTISIATYTDNVDEGNRSFSVTYLNASRVLLPASATTVTILDAQLPPVMTFTQSAINTFESSGSIAVTAQLDHPTIVAVTDTLSFSGTAVINQDYTVTTSSLNIPTGQVTQTFFVTPVRGSGGKNIVIGLGAPSRGTTGTPSTLTITIASDPYTGPTIVSSTDSSKVLYLSGLNNGSVFPLSESSSLSASGFLLSKTAVNSPQVRDFGFSGDQLRFIFLSNNVRANDFDIFSMKSDGSQLLQLNPAGWATGRQVRKFKALSGTTKVAFLGDQAGGTGAKDLYSVNTDSSSLMNLVVGLTGGKSVADFDVAGNGSKIVFLSDYQVLGKNELYALNPDGSSLMKLNGTLASGYVVDAFAISPDSSQVVYRTKSSTDSSLYVTPLAGGSSMLLSSPIGGRNIGSFKISPDSSRVAYTHNYNSSSLYDLYCLNINGSFRTLMNQTLVTGGAIKSYDFSPGSTKMYYIAEVATLGSPDLYAVNTDGSSRSKINNTLASGGRITQASFTGNSNSVVYLGYQDSASTQELYAASSIGTNRVKLNLTPVASGQVRQFLLSADSSKAFYLADQDIAGTVEVYSSVIATGVRANLTASMPSGRSADAFYLLPNNSRLLYRSNQGDGTRYDWYSMALDGSGWVKIFAP